MDRRTRDHFAGCLLGGAVGDAMGAPVEAMSFHEIQTAFGVHGITRFARAFGKTGAITDDTQLMLFTAEGLVRAAGMHREKGECHLPSVLRRAYLRWSGTQGEFYYDSAFPAQHDGWLYSIEELHFRRAPGTTCFAALAEERAGTMEEPVNHSKGCGAVARIAPVGLVAAEPFSLGCEIAALTHGHPSAYLAAGSLAHLMSEIANGRELSDAVGSAREELARWPSHEECAKVIDAAVGLAGKGSSVQDPIGMIGRGIAAEEALAISIFCALTAEDFAGGVLRSVNHGGDSDATGCITGSILGTLWGKQAIPEGWLEVLELREVIEEVAGDLHSCFVEQACTSVNWAAKYPPW